MEKLVLALKNNDVEEANRQGSLLYKDFKKHFESADRYRRLEELDTLTRMLKLSASFEEFERVFEELTFLVNNMEFVRNVFARIIAAREGSACCAVSKAESIIKALIEFFEKGTPIREPEDSPWSGLTQKDIVEIFYAIDAAHKGEIHFLCKHYEEL